MTISLLRCSPKRFLRLALFTILLANCGAFSTLQAANPSKSPILLSDSISTRAIALESVTLRPEPFPLTASAQFGSDTRTRVCIFAMNLELLAGEGSSAFSADAEDAAHSHYLLTVEYVGQVPGFEGITMIVVRLNDAMTDLGDVLLRLNLHGMSSNRVRVGVGHLGGGPTDDVGAVPTPAPATPPSPDTPLTIDQYRNQFSDPTLAAGPDAVRFLEQATWGPSTADLQHVRSIGFQAWLNEQFNEPPQFGSTQSDYPSLPLYPVDPTVGCPTASPTPAPATCGRDNYTLYPLQQKFFQNALTQPDQLRQRVAFALHQLLVISGRDLNNDEASWMAPYLQVLDRNAFGNFRNTLMEVTLSPSMGDYLSMAGNSKAAPNENYAREIMQLFSVGVDTLNPDGTPVLDAQGNRIPTYDQSTITNLARVFTGWNITTTQVTVNGALTNVPDYITPMVLVNNTNTYDTAQKTLLNGLVLPACTNCTTSPNFKAYKTNEMNAAIDNLFNHQNTGPYLCTQLIHQLVTSNPSPLYVGRCSAAFANNGSGVRGDMKAVITAILLDPEARGDVKTAQNYGHLREPVLLMTNLLRTLNATSDGVLASSPFSYTNDLGQDLFNPPTVFSYYSADYGLPGTTLFGPEYGLLDTTTTYRRANFVNTLLLANGGNGIPASQPNRPSGTQVNYSSYQALAGNPQQLVDTLDTSMMHGTMSASTKSNIVQAVTNIVSSDVANRTRTAIYLVATSSQYQVER